MKTIPVDFTKDNIGTIAREGELNRTQLVFALDEDLQMCDFINVKFGTNENLEDDECPVLEYLHPDEGGTTLTIKLNQDMTVRGVLYMQLDGYAIDSETSEPHMIAKSPVVSGVITPSIKGVKKKLEGNPGLLDRILTKVYELLKKSHMHNNKRTIDKFYCDTAEAEGSEFPILPDHIGADRLKYNGIYLRYCTDGGVVVDGEEITDEETGQKFFRVELDNGPFVVGKKLAFFDIPIIGTKEVTTESTEPGIIGTQSTGIQLQLGGTGGKTIPIVTVLPETAKEGDVVLYYSLNTLTPYDSGKEIYFNWDWVNNLSQDDSQLNFSFSGRPAESSLPNMRIDIAKYTNLVRANFTFNYSTSNADIYQIAFSANDTNGYSFDLENSYHQAVVNGVTTKEGLTEPITHIKAVDFQLISTRSNGFENITAFWSKPRLMHYHSGAWKELYFIPTKTSELDNDSGFITLDDLPEIPSNGGDVDLTNYYTKQEIDNKGFATADEINGISDEIAVERSRINAFAALAEGSTTGDAELTDIRIGYDGKTYANAGEAVRKQISDVAHLYDTSIFVGEMTDGKYITPRGAEDVSTASSVTDFIEVVDGYTIQFDNLFLSGNRSVVAYDENKTFLRVLIYNTSETSLIVPITSDIKYIRATGKAGVPVTAKLVSAPINTDIQKVKDINTATWVKVNEFENIVDRHITPAKIYTGYYINKSGSIVKDTTQTVYMIPVIDGKTLKITGAYTNANTYAMYSYDAEFNPISELEVGILNADKTVDVTVNGYSYIGITVVPSTAPYFNVEYVDHITKIKLTDEIMKPFAENDDIGNYISSNIAYNPSELTAGGYIYIDGVSITEYGSGYYTPYIEVLENQEIELANIWEASFMVAFFYDENKNYIGRIKSDTNNTVVTKRITTPHNARYMRFNVYVSQRENVTVKYTNKIKRDYLPLNLVNGWYKQTNKRIGEVFKNAASFPIITFIDDDTPTVAAVQLYHDICVELGIKGGYAVITQQLDKQPELTELLLQYEREGFHATTHCNAQTNIYQTGSTRNLSACEEDLVTALQKMQKYGFTDYKLWCSPYGVSDTDIQNLARKWGMECLVKSGCSTYETTEAKSGRFALQRISLQQQDTEGGFNMAGIKNAIDEAVAVNGWVLITTHMSEAGWADNLDRFREVVNYAKNAGMKVKTLNEAWRIREPIYKLYETF